MEIVWPTVNEGDPLSAAMILRLHIWADAGAVKLTLQLRGGMPEPLTVMAKPHDVPLFEQLIV